MNETIQIKCPFCGAVLSVRNMPGIESKNVTCPVCKNKYPFTEYKRTTPTYKQDDPDTEYPSYGDGRTRFNNDGRTLYNYKKMDELTDLPEQNFTLGKLRVEGTSVSFQLKPGRNVVGRKAKASSSDFQIETGDNRSMSREHILVEVKKVPGKGFMHYVSLYKEKVNRTFIGSEQLMYGDCLVLSHGDIIKLPDATLKFIIPDEDATEF